MSSKKTSKRDAARKVARRDFVKAVGAAAATLAPRLRAAAAGEGLSFQSSWRGSRIWAGREFWANPLQDWRVDDGEVIARAAAGRTRGRHPLPPYYWSDWPSG